MRCHNRHDAAATERGCSTPPCATLPRHATRARRLPELQAGAGMWSNLGALPCIQLGTGSWRRVPDVIGSMSQAGGLPRRPPGDLPGYQDQAHSSGIPTLNRSAGMAWGPRRPGPRCHHAGAGVVKGSPLGSGVCGCCWSPSSLRPLFLRVPFSITLMEPPS